MFSFETKSKYWNKVIPTTKMRNSSSVIFSPILWPKFQFSSPLTVFLRYGQLNFSKASDSIYDHPTSSLPQNYEFSTKKWFPEIYYFTIYLIFWKVFVFPEHFLISCVFLILDFLNFFGIHVFSFSQFLGIFDFFKVF